MDASFILSFIFQDFSKLLKEEERGKPYCQCVGSFTGKRCEDKSEFAYIAGGVAGAVIFLILLVLLIWMICVRASRAHRTSPEKILGAATDQNGSQVSKPAFSIDTITVVCFKA